MEVKEVNSIAQLKEYLNQIRTITELINEKRESITELYAKVGVQGISYEYKPKSDNRNPDIQEHLQLTILQLKDECNESEIDLYKKKLEIIDIIHSITNINQIRVLYYYYVSCKSWEWIAYKLNYEYHYVHRIHGEALENILNKIQKDTN